MTTNKDARTVRGILFRSASLLAPSALLIIIYYFISIDIQIATNKIFDAIAASEAGRTSTKMHPAYSPDSEIDYLNELYLKHNANKVKHEAMVSFHVAFPHKSIIALAPGPSGTTRITAASDSGEIYVVYMLPDRENFIVGDIHSAELMDRPNDYLQRIVDEFGISGIVNTTADTTLKDNKLAQLKMTSKNDSPLLSEPSESLQKASAGYTSAVNDRLESAGFDKKYASPKRYEKQLTPDEQEKIAKAELTELNHKIALAAKKVTEDESLNQSEKDEKFKELKIELVTTEQEIARKYPDFANRVKTKAIPKISKPSKPKPAELPKNAKAKDLGSAWSEIQSSDRYIASGPKDGKVLYVFHDPECPSCMKAEPYMRKLEEKGVQIRYLPVSIIRPFVSKKSSYALSGASDKEKLSRLVDVNNNKVNESALALGETKKGAAMQQANFDLLVRIGDGTPTYFYQSTRGPVVMAPRNLRVLSSIDKVIQ